MSDKVDVRQALRVFNTIMEHGEQRGGESHLGGIIASAGYDGYTVTLRNDYVTLNVYFHNKFSLDFSSRQQLMLFLDKLAALDRKKFG